MINDARIDVRPLLLKVGVAIALSFAGFFFSRIRTKRGRRSLPPPCPDHKRKLSDSEDGAGIQSEVHGNFTQRMPSCREIASFSSEIYDKPCIRVIVDNSSMNPSPSSRHSGDKGYLLPEFTDIVKELDMAGGNTLTSPRRHAERSKSNEGTPKASSHASREDYKQEIMNLKSMVTNLEERERYLEYKLLEYYGLKEQEKAVMELQNRLKVNTVEAKLFSMRIESLQVENGRLRSQLSEYTMVDSELEAAKAKIKNLKKKFRTEADHSREQIMKLRERVARVQEQDASYSTSHLKDKILKDLESEAGEVRKSNSNLCVENSELAKRLDSAQMLASSIMQDVEVINLRGEASRLREENEHLTKEVDRLQEDRCADAEELVYLRWVNACLRYEMRNYKPAPGKTVARDLSKCLSPRSEEKAKQLILEYANCEGVEEQNLGVSDVEYDQWSSSHSNHTEELEDLSLDFSAGNKTHTSTKKKFFGKIRKLITGKESSPRHHHHHQDHDDGKASPLVKSKSVDDFGRRSYSCESPMASSSTDAGKDEKYQLRSPRFRTPSQSSTRSSLDLQRLTSLNGSDTTKLVTESMNRSSSAGCSYAYRRFVLGRENANASPLESIPDKVSDTDSHKSDLMKYAEVLKDSPWTRRTHRKSASFSPG